MSSSKKAPRGRSPKDANKKPGKKKTSILVQEKVEFVDYKDVNLLQRFMSDRSKIRSRRVSGNSTQQQREIATAIKNAREMALLPYARRVATQRAPRRDDRGERGDRGDRGDRGERNSSTTEETANADAPAEVETTTAEGE